MAVIICIESLAAVMYLKSPKRMITVRVFVFVWGAEKENLISTFGDVPPHMFCVAVLPINQGVI